MKKNILILIVTFLASSTFYDKAFFNAQQENNTATKQEVTQAFAKSIKELLEKQDFAQDIGSFLGKYANQIVEKAEKLLNNTTELHDTVKKIKRYAELYQTEHRDLLHEFNKKENKLNKNLYKSLDSTPKDEHANILNLHENALKELHKDSAFSAIKELARLQDELTVLGLDVLVQLQKLLVDPEKFMDFIQDWVAIAQKEFATTIKA